MVDKIHYRWDFIGLSTDTKPTPAESPKVVNGSTYYESDTSKLFVFYKDTWYERKPLGGGGGSDINVVQTTGDSTTDVMSQKAVTDALNALPTGGITELTSADYNWPVDNPDGVAPWLLEPGLYYANFGVAIYVTDTVKNTAGQSLYVANKTATNTEVFVSNLGGNLWVKNIYSNTTGQRLANYSFLNSNIILQVTGTSTTDVMSQNATSKMIFADPANATSGIAIGKESPQATSSRAVAIGNDSRANFGNSVALGYYARTSHGNSVALGAGAVTTDSGQVSIQKASSGYGYNNTVYTLLSGVYDPQNAHDAATKGYVDSLIAALEARIAALEGN